MAASANNPSKRRAMSPKPRAVELAVIGPEAPLAAGVADALAAAGVPAFGPIRGGGSNRDLESVLPRGRGVCRRADGRGASIRRSQSRRRSGLRALNSRTGGGVVIKADGLAAGKGVIDLRHPRRGRRRDTCEVRGTGRCRGAPYEAEKRASSRSVTVGRRSPCRSPVTTSALLDGDTGPNTGGMGAYSPLPDLPDEAAHEILERFHRPVLAELARRGYPFRGALYAGLMLTAAGPRLLECNARLGDPETQVILPRLSGPLGPLLLTAARGSLRDAESILGGLSRPASRTRAVVGIVLAAAGYPAQPEPGARIHGPRRQWPAVQCAGRARFPFRDVPRNARRISGHRRTRPDRGRPGARPGFRTSDCRTSRRSGQLVGPSATSRHRV